MSAIISTIDQFRLTAKINNNLDIEVLQPFLTTARDIYLVRYLGVELVDILELATIPTRAEKVLELARKALGPLALWCGNSELSIRISDSGFTVAKQDGSTGYVPASDTKIAKVADSLQLRGFQYLDQLLEYLEANANDFPEWKESKYYTLRGGNYIQTATQFQEIGLVDIGYSRLTFESLRPLMTMLEQRYVSELITDALDITLRSKLDTTKTAAETALIMAIRRFVACKTAELHTSNASKEARSGADNKEYRPIIRPVYEDRTDSGNFFAEQASYYQTKIQQLLTANAVEFGIEIDTPLAWNSADQSFFYSEG